MFYRYAGIVLVFLALTCPAEAKNLHGPERLTLQEANDFLRQICAETLPDFVSAPAVLDKAGFKYHVENEVYYHPRYDLSFMIEAGLDTGSCSMVFLSNEDFSALGMLLSIVAISTVKWPEGEAQIEVNDDATAFHTKAGNGGEFMFFKAHSWTADEPMYHAVMTANHSGS